MSEHHHDDELENAEPLLRRREALIAAGLIGGGVTWLSLKASEAAAVIAAKLPAIENASCVLTPELTEGPYWIDTNLRRRNIIAGRPGLPLELRLTVANATTCSPIKGADVEIWHCDAGGNYSGVSGGGGGGTASPTDSTRYLRGHQIANARGVVIFRTIYPGFYPGRTAHIHIKVHHSGKVHTGQLFFSDAVSDVVYGKSPYNNAQGTRDVRNSDDNIYLDAGSSSLLKLAKRKVGSGYIGTSRLGVSI